VIVTVTGGAGYLGAPVVWDLLAAGHKPIVLDTLLHGQDKVAAKLESSGVEVIRGDVLDDELRRQALDGADAIVHLAAIVGDPACAKQPEMASRANLEGTRALIEDAAKAGQRFVFASTCSNYGKMADSTQPIDETGELRPVSLYARQKVEMELELFNGGRVRHRATCLRFATLYGVADRMRFDLTINEFVRDLWAGRDLEVFGELFWRPYVHVKDAARAVRMVLDSPIESVGGEVFNVGYSEENYRKLDLVELITRTYPVAGKVRYVKRDEDPRDYKVSFEKIRSGLRFMPEYRVADGIAETIRALDDGKFGDPFDSRFLNS